MKEIFLCGLILLFSVLQANEKTVSDICKKDSHIYLDEKTYDAGYLFDEKSECLKAFMEYRSKKFITADSVFKTEDIVSDLKDLKEILRTSYVGYPELSVNMDMNEFFEKHIKRLKSKKEWRVDDALFPLFIEMQKIVPDNHFQFMVMNLAPKFSESGWWKSEYYIYADASDILPDQKKCTFTSDKNIVKIFPETLEKKKYIDKNGGIKDIFIVSALSASEKLNMSCEVVKDSQKVKKDFILTRFDSHQKPEEETVNPYEYRDYGDFGYIKLLSFSDKYQNQLKSFINDAQNHRKHKYLIIDLRGNGGGNSKYFGEWLKHLNVQVDKELFIRWQETLSKETLTFIYNYYTSMKMAGADINTAKYLDMERVKLAEEIKGKKFNEENSGLHKMFSPNADNTDMFEGKIVFLYDTNTVSAAEMFMLLSFAGKNTLRIGERSRGMMIYGNSFPSFISKKTGIIWSIPTRKFDFFIQENGKFKPLKNLEWNGIAPDYYLSKDASLDELIKVIKEKIYKD